MKRTSWRKKIVAACKDVGTYRPAFDPIIETLAGILERRDGAKEKFEKNPVYIVSHTNKGGGKYAERNPLLRTLQDLERDALAYWRDLGLTPAGLKRINEQEMQPKKADPFTELLKDLENGL